MAAFLVSFFVGVLGKYNANFWLTWKVLFLVVIQKCIKITGLAYNNISYKLISGADWFYLSAGSAAYIIAGLFKLITAGGFGK